MSGDHSRRLYRVCDDAIKKAAMGEVYGLAVEFCFAPAPTPEGSLSLGPAWFVLVTIRNSGIGLPDIGNGFPVPGILPADDLFQQVAVALLEKCRQEREASTQSAMNVAGMQQGLQQFVNGNGKRGH